MTAGANPPFAAVRRWGPAACLLAAALLFAFAHAHHPEAPAAATLTSGWWAFWDQGRSLEAAQALARGDASLGHQFYEPGYPLLAVPFVWLGFSDPFFAPNLAALLLACWLFGALGERLVSRAAWVRPACMALFVATTVGDPRSAAAWVDPWSTTAVVPLLLAAALATMRVLDRVRPWPCFLAGLSALAVAAFRPGDVLIAATPCAAAIGWAILRDRPFRRATQAAALAGLAGAACALAPVLAAHAAIWGMHPSAYMLISEGIGFNLLLLPLRWVLIVVGPQPLTEGRGLAEVFPWIISGVAGGVACLVVRRGRAPHAVLLAMVAASLLLFLSYRDLHPASLWRYGTVHYFKWLLPVAALYTLVLVRGLLTGRRRWPMLGVAAVAAVALFDWRPVLQPVAAAAIGGQHELTLPAGLTDIRDGVLVPASGTWAGIYETTFGAWADRREYRSNEAFKAYPRLGGFLLVPLRPIGPGVLFRFFDGVSLAGAAAPIVVRQRLVFRPPCWMAACDPDAQFPPWPWPSRAATRPLGAPIAFHGIDPALLTPDWSGLGLTDSLWTEGSQAGLHLQLDPVPVAGATLVVDATAFIPEGSGPMDVVVEVAGHAAGQWHITDAAPHRLRMALPAGGFAPNGAVRLLFRIANPRSPAAWLPGSSDDRLLGLQVRSVTFEPNRAGS